MLKCYNCGHRFDEEEADTFTESEEFWGAPCYITYYNCPQCGSEDVDDIDCLDEEEEEE